MRDVRDDAGADARPQVVCLCGSTRFVEQLRAVNRDLTLAGAIVLAPAELEHAGGQVSDGKVSDGHAVDQQLSDEQRAALGALHLAKIDLADRVVVVNPGGYVGESTRREIRYAREAGKPVAYTDPPDDVPSARG